MDVQVDEIPAGVLTRNPKPSSDSFYNFRVQACLHTLPCSIIAEDKDVVLGGRIAVYHGKEAVTEAGQGGELGVDQPWKHRHSGSLHAICKLLSLSGRHCGEIFLVYELAIPTRPASVALGIE